ncbi:Reverse transcriptase, RNA-dependent DNA polymerase [Plasmopara halstedii]|uniref:Reverse transcriptase, RNA-dependent DNA polymerase n=1 Tax=Plasmopara halstedii TaxID=4781 RepID=A0A0P1A9S5_PLAHL|nr:Reverse transcriptase, RNA-dependent DNA polymerase [Plasmopara halstedii]CEG37330.1 Reverse transcriptase, RNA-dependent DNA polymerase [Plasmopara halstedii]|eukprot:XP_024573699.1 Reverse transcriptase, RNA-dependent DNA polymerase [Plasmopara halstedii]
MCLYFKGEKEVMTVVGIYVDDLLVTATRAAAVEQFFVSLSIKNLGPASKFLGMRVTALDTHAYVLDQEETIGEMLREHGMGSGNPTRTPIDADCYEEVTPDSSLLQENPESGSPSIRSFQPLVGNIGSDPGDDVVSLDVPRDNGRHHSHREESVAGGDVDRRPVTRDALRSLEDEVLRDRSSAERHAEVEFRCADALENLKHVVRRLPRLKDYRALSERLLAVEQANASLHAAMERLAPLEMEVVVLRAQNHLLVQLLGGRGPVGSTSAPTLPLSLAPDKR